MPNIITLYFSTCTSAKSKRFPYRRDDLYAEFKSTTERLKLNPVPLRTVARHITATDLDEADLPSTIIKELMRHPKFSTTECYIHKDTSVMLGAVIEKLKKPVADG